MLAYEVYSPPARSPESQMAEGVRFTPGGTPGAQVGMRVFVVSTKGGDARPVCPEKGNCWRTSLSPDGKRVAFISDAGGSPQLWVADVAGGAPRRVSELIIKVKHWPGDEAEWSADGREVFVPLRPPDKPSCGELPCGGEARRASGRAPRRRPAVTVYQTASGGRGARPGRRRRTAMMAHFIRENNATLAAIDVASGKSRVVRPRKRSRSRAACGSLRTASGSRICPSSRRRGEAASGTYYDLAVVPAVGGSPS